MADTLFSAGTIVASSWLNDVDKNTYNILSSVVGTNTITATGPQPFTAYLRGTRFYIVPTNTNTGPATLNVSGLGAKALTKFGATALVAGDLIVGTAHLLFYDGVQFQVINPKTNMGGGLIGIQYLTASGTYTPTPGTNKLILEGVGGGGAGGGAQITGAATMAAGGGGGAGCWGRKTILNPTATAFVIGAGGTGVAGAAGNTGGSTTFGAVLTLPGGGGGALGFANTANMLTSNASAFSGAATGADISSQGACGFAGIILSANISTSGFGANSQFGSGGPSVQVSSATFANGVVGVGFGSGGSGSCSGTNVGATLSGAAGRQGLLIAYEYN